MRCHLWVLECIVAFSEVVFRYCSDYFADFSMGSLIISALFLIAYRSYYYAIHHSGLRLKWTFRRRSLCKTGSLRKWNFRRWYYTMRQTKGLHCGVMAIYIHAIIILVGLENVQWPSKQAFLERKGRIDVYRYIHYTHICTKD